MPKELRVPAGRETENTECLREVQSGKAPGGGCSPKLLYGVQTDSRRSGEETRGPEEERRGDGTGADVVGQADNWDDNRGRGGRCRGTSYDE